MAHVFAEEDEDAPVQEPLGELDEFAAGAAEARVGGNDRAKDSLTELLVLAVELPLELSLQHPLTVQDPGQATLTRFGEQHLAAEKPREQEALICGLVTGIDQRNGALKRLEYEALRAGIADLACVEPELVHVGHDAPRWLHAEMNVRPVEFVFEVVEALLHR